MSSPIDYLIDHGLGAVIWCHGASCARPPLYLPASRLSELFGGRGLTCEGASKVLKCDGCGARGRDGRVTLLPSTLDLDDVRQGRPAGHSEGVRAEKLAKGASQGGD